MDKSSTANFNLFGILKSWIPWRSEPDHVSRDFWMPDHSCRVCYECDTQFTIFNRRHHCRHCGRVFCGKCTANSVPASYNVPKNGWEEWDKIRVCNYCFKLWEQGLARGDDGGAHEASSDSCASPSRASFASAESSSSGQFSTISLGSVSFLLEECEQMSDNFSLSPYQSAVTDSCKSAEEVEESGKINNSVPDVEDSSLHHFGSGTNRSSSVEFDYSLYQLDPKSGQGSQPNNYYGLVEYNEIQTDCGPHNFLSDEGNAVSQSLSSGVFQCRYDSQELEGVQEVGKKEDGNDIGVECEAPSSMCAAMDVDIEPVDFENNAHLWFPPDPENEEDEREASLFDDDDDDIQDGSGEWGPLQSSDSFGSSEHHSRTSSGEEHKMAMKNVVDGHFRALVSQLLQVENIPLTEEDAQESWLEIITTLSWEAATLLKPDTSRGGGMDPGGYVKVKCIASGHRSDSVVVKGVVCKKNVAHRRMTTRIEKPSLMILGGALEYQRVSNLLSSFDTLLQQEMDHLKMAVAKIEAHHPNVLLVEKSVSRYAQDYILAKDISLVLNIKRPLLERISRCTGAQIVPSIDHLSAQKLGYCDSFHVDKFLEEHGSAGQGGKKLTKTLMYFEGCPKPLGCTILLRGANGDELKKVKHVLQYGIFAAYHLALETSFLADEGASLPELPLREPITVALPNKSSCIARSISTVPGFTMPANEKLEGTMAAYVGMSECYNSTRSSELSKSSSLPVTLDSQGLVPALSSRDSTCFSSNANSFKTSPMYTSDETLKGDQLNADDSQEVLMRARDSMANSAWNTNDSTLSSEIVSSEAISLQQNVNVCETKAELLKEEFPPSPSDHQSILVSLSSRCVWKGTVCERSHLFRIKYYGSFDKPLGRFLQDQLFDQNYRCRSCDEPSEAHVQCYTHRQGTLTISVKKLPEIYLPGEREGKIWMWHRCLRCPRTSGNPPATRRVIMSDAAWGLSFGKFLELSFSNHAAASRVASCGHSLHRDCLRFYGSGNMVACFRYASIYVYSVYLPPAKVDFNCEVQEWVQKEADEVVVSTELLFSEVFKALRQISEKRSLNSDRKSPEFGRSIMDLKALLQNEKAGLEELLHKILKREVKTGQPAIDILEINQLRRQLLVQSYLWDRYLVAASSDDCSFCWQADGFISDSEEKMLVTSDSNMVTTPGKVVTGIESLPMDSNLSTSSDHSDMAHQIRDANLDLTCLKNDHGDLSSFTSVSELLDPLETRIMVRRALSDSQFMNLSDTLDAAWTGKTHPGVGTFKDNGLPLLGSVSVDVSMAAVAERLAFENQIEERSTIKILSSNLKIYDNVEETRSWLGMPLLNLYRSWNKTFPGNSQKFDTLGGYNPVYLSAVRESELQSGARLILEMGVNETVIPIYDDEPTSIISYALLSKDYHKQLVDDGEKTKETSDSSSLSLSLQDAAKFYSFDESVSESFRSLGSLEDAILSTSAIQSSFMSDSVQTKSLHVRVSFEDSGPLEKRVKYTVTCYHAKQFDALRKICCPSEMDFIRSLSRCKKWGAQGGKSNVFFAKTLDDRFIIKQVTKTELESFGKFAPGYFKYLTDSTSTKSPTCLAKILGIYQVSAKHLKGGKESRMDVLVMENLLFRRNVTRIYDLKGSSRSRYNPDSSGSNKVLLDQNLIEAMPTSPIFVGNKAKRLLERAVWNDTSFLASVDVMDYSLLVGVDEEKHELVLGIIDFMRQYTWDKHLETWVKASGILGGPKNASPTVISPQQYKKRFRKAMTTYFLMVPDQWSPPTIIPGNKSHSDFLEEGVS